MQKKLDSAVWNSLKQSVVEPSHINSFVEPVPRKEGESIDAWGDRIDAIKLAEEENYELYGMFYVFKNKIQDERPEDYGKCKLQDGKAVAELDLQNGN